MTDGRSDTGSGSSRSLEEETGKHSANGSQRSGKNLRNEEPIEYTDEERVEILRKLDSIKDHILRGSSTDNLGPGPPPYPYPVSMYPPQDPYRRPPPIPNLNYYPSTPSRYNDVPPPYSPYSYPNSSFGGSPVGGGYARWPSDVDSEMGAGAFTRGYVKKAVINDKEARRCHPIAGGAPFIACLSCFELLYLPKKKKLMLSKESQRKLQCGACSHVITFKIVDKKLVFSSTNQETKPVSLISSLEVEKDITVTEVVVVEEEPIQQDAKDDDEERLSVSSEQQQQKEVVKSVRRRAKGSVSTETAGNASLLELFEYSNVNRAALTYGMSKLGYNKSEKIVSFKKQESVATETVVSYNGYSEEDTRKSNGREEENNSRPRSSETEIVRSSTDENEDQMKSLEVWINGHLISEDLVSSAEKLAGPIQAGNYWYDYRAGFWGVMGKPCLGIIPPFIEEFSHPMPEKCAAGNSEVFVNGRELHKRDFELLVGRGLPRDKNRSYIVDISGRILDGDSGEELKSLGKLAPTIDKVKHGFGMRVPRSLAS